MTAHGSERRCPPSGPDGGRTWWAHFAITRINMTPTILPKKIEDLREASATLLNATLIGRIGST